MLKGLMLVFFFGYINNLGNGENRMFFGIDISCKVLYIGKESEIKLGD